MRRRFREYVSRLQSGIHKNDHLQKAWNKYGQISFRMCILEYFPIIEMSILREIEYEYIKIFNTTNRDLGYNILERDYSPTLETREKLRKSAIGRKMSSATKLKISAANKGTKPKKHTIEAAIKSRIKSHVFLSPEGEKVAVDNISEFCRMQGLNQPCMSEVSNGKRKSHKGWKNYGSKAQSNHRYRKWN